MAQFPNSDQADGIWTLKKVRRAILGENWPTALQPDQFFANTVLLLNAENASDGGQNNTFLDSSSNAHTITRNGNVTQGSFSPFSVDDGKWGNYFDGSSRLFSSSGAYSNFGTGDFTIDLAFWTDQTSSRVISIGDGANSTSLYFFTDATDNMCLVNSNVRVYEEDASAVYALNQWNQISIVRSSGTIRIFVNGTGLASTAFTAAISGDVRIGVAWYNGATFGNNLEGYISNVRFIKGSAVNPPAGGYTSALTAVSGTSYLTCQSNRFVDNSSNGVDVTVQAGTPKVVPFSPFPQTAPYNASQNGGSGYFDGSGDYLVATSGTDFVVGTGDFTIEGWAYTSDNTRLVGAYSQRLIDIDSGNLGIWIQSSTGYLSVNAGTSISSTTVFPENQWNHFALTRSGSSLKLFLNGTEIVSATNTNNLGSSGAVSVGSRNQSSDGAFLGYIANCRLVKGTALYTSTFTPPTAPLTEVSGTSLLCNFTNASIVDVTGRNVLETVGNAQVDTTTVKYGTGAMEFDGTGDRLVGKETELLAFGTGDYTIEFWMYPRDTGYGCWIDTRNGNPSTTGISIFNNGTGLELYGSGAILIVSSAVTLNTWQHFAVTRSGTDLKAFIDGTQVGTTQTNSDNHTAGRLMIGDNVGVGFPLDGFIDDLRITKGIARYTANFTPPTKELPVIGA